MDSSTTEIIIAVVGGGGMVKLAEVVMKNRREDRAQEIDTDAAMRSELVAGFKDATERAVEAGEKFAQEHALRLQAETRVENLEEEVARLQLKEQELERRIGELEAAIQEQAKAFTTEITAAVQRAIADYEQRRAPQT